MISNCCALKEPAASRHLGRSPWFAYQAKVLRVLGKSAIPDNIDDGCLLALADAAHPACCTPSPSM